MPEEQKTHKINRLHMKLELYLSEIQYLIQGIIIEFNKTTEGLSKTGLNIASVGTLDYLRSLYTLYVDLTRFYDDKFYLRYSDKLIECDLDFTERKNLLLCGLKHLIDKKSDEIIYIKNKCPGNDVDLYNAVTTLKRIMDTNNKIKTIKIKI